MINEYNRKKIGATEESLKIRVDQIVDEKDLSMS